MPWDGSGAARLIRVPRVAVSGPGAETDHNQVFVGMTPGQVQIVYKLS